MKKELNIMSKKYINIDPNILIEWEYNSQNVSENYTIWSDLSKNTRNFLSTTNLNDIYHNLFVVDPITKKYSKIDDSKFNFLKLQNYSSAPISYDKITIYFPTNFNFGVYLGLYLKISAYDYIGRSMYCLSNYYYDKTQTQTINGVIEYADSLIQLSTPFVYNQKEWGKYLTYLIPSVYATSNQRIVNSTTNITEPNTINYNLTNGTGLNINNPIYVDFSFITSKETVFNVPYYYLGDIYKTSISLKPEYQSLGVDIVESSQGDFFEIYGVYNNSNENMDNFVNDLESKGRKINIEYVVTLYEENLISGFPLTFLVSENFSQKIEYRPIIKYSNTTAAIDVEMKIVDLLDNSSISRFASIGLKTNLLKYGKTLAKLSVDNMYKPTIYNYKYDKIYDLKTTSNVTDINLVKVPFPILINNYKILANNYTPFSQGDYKGMGLLNIILSPFDNIIKFQIGIQNSINDPILPYNLSELMLNSKLNLSFKSDAKTIEKDVYYQTDENKFELGIVVFKINQEDIPILKQMSKDKFDNFYIILNSNKTKTLLYSGKFKIYENIKFLPQPNTSSGTTTKQLPDLPTNSGTTGIGINEIIPPQFDADGIPLLQPGARGTLDSYRNLIVWLKSGLTKEQINSFYYSLNKFGIVINYGYQSDDTDPIVIIIERINIANIRRIKDDSRVDNVKELPLDFGWKKSTDKMLIFNKYGSNEDMEAIQI